MQFSDNARSVILMNVAMATFTMNDTAMKLVMENIGFSQAVAVRGVMTTLALLLVTWWYSALTVHVAAQDRLLILLRTIADIGATLTFLIALQHMEIANLSAINQSTPLVVTVAAAIFFGEKLGWRRLTAIIVGLIGVCIILRPDSEGFDLWALLGLGSVACVVIRDLLTRKMTSAVPSSLIALAASVGVLLLGLSGMTLGGWQPMSTGDWLLVVFAAVTLIIGYITVVATMRIGDVGAVAPFRYMSLLWAIFLGWLAFGDLPDAMMLFGASLVVGSGIFTLWRERKIAAPEVVAPTV